MEVGQRAFRLVAVGPEFRVRVCGFAAKMQVFRCDCGNYTAVRLSGKHGSKTGKTKSCGCLHLEQAAEAGRNSRIHGDSQGPLRRLMLMFHGMHRRCHPTKGHKLYGLVGIRVCKAWQKYETFKAWALANGYRDDLELDRIKNSKGYSPSNCRFVTRQEQTRNTSQNQNFTLYGETKCLMAWAEDARCAVAYETLRCRVVNYGWDFKRALTTPSKRAKK